ncbi:hypothetical protein GOQ29_06850 [Clostridium sp. D2Q-14]|uniref:hypothetical protein n=1 Tax=Anaeromonas gelatinilytica TaxID=2683194 RepID=UPI00193BFE73|nr:hypothetical protein [Anaeromonas gelatinilytica]MBS4535335.1 hypothetical protein [Anaeromonas gelatinilytica]
MFSILNNKGVDSLDFRSIDIEKNKDILIKFRKDTQYISFSTLEGFDEKAYIDRMTERVNNFSNFFVC